MVTSAAAHHSYGSFDTRRVLELSGTVVRFDWSGPHTTTILAVDGDGDGDGDGEDERATWRFEGMSPDFLGRRGWNRRTLEPGDPVTIAYYPRKDGEAGGLLVRVTEADGTVRVMIVTDGAAEAPR